MGKIAVAMSAFYADHYGNFRYQRDSLSKQRFWKSEYPVEKAITNSKLGVFPNHYDRDWEPLPSRHENQSIASLVRPGEAPSSFNLFCEQRVIEDQADMMRSAGGSCVAAMLEARAEQKANDVAACRSRLDARDAFKQGHRSIEEQPTEHKYQLDSPFRGRTDAPQMLYHRWDRHKTSSYLSAPQGYT